QIRFTIELELQVVRERPLRGLMAGASGCTVPGPSRTVLAQDDGVPLAGIGTRFAHAGDGHDCGDYLRSGSVRLTSPVCGAIGAVDVASGARRLRAAGNDWRGPVCAHC